MSLYQLADEYKHINWVANNLPEEEKDESFDLALRSIEEDINVAAQSLCYVYRELDGNASLQAKEASRLLSKAKRTARRAERVRQFVKEQMQQCGLKQIDWKTGSANLQKVGGPQALTIDEAVLPDRFWKETITKTPNREAIMHALQNGDNVMGVTVEERGQSVRFL
jgi:hypothetical protein